jgi:class III cytochrome C family protein
MKENKMKARSMLFPAMVVFASMVWAQTTPAQAPSADIHSHSAAGTAKPAEKQPGMPADQGMAGMREQHMQEMKANLAKMHALLDQMKTSAAGMDPKDQQAMQVNIQMWQMMIDHLDAMAQHMQSMQGMGMGGMHDRMPGTEKMTPESGADVMKKVTPASGTETKPVTPPPSPAVSATPVKTPPPVASGKATTAQTKVPKDVVIFKAAPMGAVKFLHSAHAKDRNITCQTCHHPSKPEKSAQAAQQVCSDCHTKTPTPPMKTKLQAAFHNPSATAGTCIDCHKARNAAGKNAPAKCQECHRKENG